MVIRDPNEKPVSSGSILNTVYSPSTPGSKPPVFQTHLASPIDRLAATVVDVFVVLTPILYLVTAPFKKNLVQASLLNQQFELFYSAALIALVSLVMIVAYETFFIWWMGATIGKWAFGLRVVKVWSGRRPEFFESFVRSLVWVLGWLPLAIPHLSVFSNEKRRAIHDRVADTIVIAANKKQRVGPPGLLEISFARGALASFIAFCSLFVTVYTAQLYSNLRNQEYMAELLEQDGVLCEEIGKASEEWNISKDLDKPTRLEIAMSMYAAGALSDDCLQAESEFVLRESGETPLVYFARSFIFADRPDLSNAYLEKVCSLNPVSEECEISKTIDAWVVEDWSLMSLKLKQLRESKKEFVKIWVLRRLVQNGEFKMAKVMLEELSPQHSISNFLAGARTQIYWGLDKLNHAEAAAETAYEVMNREQKLDLSGWLCWHEMKNQCSGESSKSCEVFTSTLPKELFTINDVYWSLAYFKQEECKNTAKPKLDVVAKRVAQPDVKRLVSALSLVSSKKKQSVKELRQIVADKNVHLWVRHESIRQLLKIGSDEQVMAEIYAQWKLTLKDLEWRQTGRLLLAKLIETGQFKESMAVGQTMLRDRPQDEWVKQQMIVAEFKSGRADTAWQALKNYETEREEQAARQPASSTEWDSIIKLLKRKFGGP